MSYFNMGFNENWRGKNRRCGEEKKCLCCAALCRQLPNRSCFVSLVSVLALFCEPSDATAVFGLLSSFFFF